jgi:7,8-dihydropterin-6-yl-methyl-4-(beta-D-ribofuranosyl)aminobenzene 5'-phosphate synthase
MNKRILIITCLILLAPVYFTSATEKSSGEQKQQISITILYDNYVFTEGLRSDWGFSCLVTGTEKTILFDTGTRGELLLENIEKLNINPKDIEIIVISHNHGDHTGGLPAFLAKNSNVLVYLPPSCSASFIQEVKETGAKVLVPDAPVEICKDVHLTRPMGEQIIEQSMILDTPRGTVVITGCAHPGIVDIVRKSKAIVPKDIYLVLGGFHLLQKSETELEQIISEFKKLGVRKAAPTHCTGDRAIQMFKQAYGTDFEQMGVGRTLKIEAASLSANAGFLIKDGSSLFPIACYELPKDDVELGRMSRAGINLVRCGSRSDLDRVAAVGILGWIVIPMQQGSSDAVREKIEAVVTHPALAIWEGPDEVVHNFTAWSGLYRTKKVYKSPDAWAKQSPEAVAYSEEQAKQIIPRLQEVIKLIRTLDQNKHQIWINEAAESDLKFVRQYIDHIDITGCDIYPVKEGSRDLAAIGESTERWKKVSRNEKPVWMVLQAFSWSELGDYYGHKTVVYPSFAESRFMAYDAIVHGASGILYWGSHYLKSSEFRQSLYALTSELAALQTFLVAPDYSQARLALVELQPNPLARGVRMSVRRADQEWIVIMVNEDDRPYLGVEVTGLDELNGRTLELLYGDEKVTVERGELITRIKPLEVKVFATARKWEAEQREGRNFPQ